MISAAAHLPDGSAVEVDCRIEDGEVIADTILLDGNEYGWDDMYAQVIDDSKDNHLIKHFKFVTISEYIQMQIDEKADDLLDDTEDGATEARNDERNGR